MLLGRKNREKWRIKPKGSFDIGVRKRVLRRNLGVMLFLFCWATFLLWGKSGAEAVAAVTYAVYNESQGLYFDDLQEALDGAQTGDVIRVVIEGASFNCSLNWRVNGVTLDLNGAVITSPWGQSTISVDERVYQLALKNGVLKTSDTQKSCIEVPGNGGPSLELKLENMKIYGGKSIYLRRNGRLEWSGGQALGNEYGVLVEYSVSDFSAVFTDVTFMRSSKGAIYFSGLKWNNPVTSWELSACKFGEKANSLAGPALWVEAGSTVVNVRASSFEAWGSNKDLIRIRAAGTVMVADSYFHRGTGCALSLEGANIWLGRNEIITQEGYSENSYNPAVIIISPYEAEITGNQLAGPGTLGMRISGGKTRLEGNEIYGFLNGLEVLDSNVTALHNVITGCGVGFALKSAVRGYIVGNELRADPHSLGGNTGILIQTSQEVELEDNLIQGWSTGSLVTGSTGITFTQTTFSENQTGASISSSTGITVTHATFSRNKLGARISNSTGILLDYSTWEDNETGLLLADTIEADIHHNRITRNNTGFDLLSIVEVQLTFTKNDIYGNVIALQAPTGETMTAPDNYWGSSRGPYHESLNVQGHGDIIRGDLNFVPWAPYAHGEDNAPPSVSLTLAGDIWLTSEPLPLEISLTEENWLDRVILAVYGRENEVITEEIWWGDEWSGSSDITWETNTIPDGPYRFLVVAVDGKGNEGYDEGYIILDRHPPANPQVYINGGAAETSTLTVDLALLAEDVNGVTEVMIANEGGPPGEWEPYRRTKSWELLPGPPGLRRVTVRFRDRAGWESQAEASIVLNPPPGLPEEGREEGNGGAPDQGHNNTGDGNPEHPETIAEEEEGRRPDNSGDKGGRENRKRQYDDEKRKESMVGFSDVSPQHWAWSAIIDLAAKGLLGGDDQGKFYPDKVITRAELAALVDSIITVPEASPMNWIDVPFSAWYATPVARLAGAGIIVGYADGTFRPESPVSREETAVILSRVAGLARIKENKASGEGEGELLLLRYKDSTSVSPWAHSDVLWAVKEGLIRGYPDGTLRPGDQLTRAEAAVLIQRFLQLIQLEP